MPANPDPRKKRFKRKPGFKALDPALRERRVAVGQKMLNVKATDIIAREKLVDRLRPELDDIKLSVKFHQLSPREAIASSIFAVEQAVIDAVVKDPTQRNTAKRYYSKLLIGKSVLGDLADNGFTTIKRLRNFMSEAIKVGTAFKKELEVHPEGLKLLRQTLKDIEKLPSEKTIGIDVHDVRIEYAYNLVIAGFRLSLGKHQNIGLFTVMEKMLREQVLDD